MSEIDLTLRGAEFEDAASLIDLLNQLGSETEFMSFDRFGMGLKPELLGRHLEAIAASDHQLLLVAEANGALVAVASIAADEDPRSYWRSGHRRAARILGARSRKYFIRRVARLGRSWGGALPLGA